MVLWFTFSYLPIAHMVWFWMGPDAYTGKDVVDAMNAKAGLLWQRGALDFAGGTVVHINAGIAGLVGAMSSASASATARKRCAAHPDVTMIGASMLWFGWFGFNAGSALEAERLRCWHSSTPSRPPPRGARLDARRMDVQGQAVDARRRFGRRGRSGRHHSGGRQRRPDRRVRHRPRRRLGLPVGRQRPEADAGADDSLDVFGVHGVGGIVGALLTGVFNRRISAGRAWSPTGSRPPSTPTASARSCDPGQGGLLTVVWSGVVAFIAYKIVDLLIGLRVTEEEEREGLDISAHGETAYHGCFPGTPVTKVRSVRAATKAASRRAFLSGIAAAVPLQLSRQAADRLQIVRGIRQ